VPVPGLESGRVQLQSAYMVYANEQRERVREENPDLTLGRVGKLMGDRWQAMSVEERAPYEAKAAQNQG
jgi:non-histone chromosomal protein 6